MGKSISIVGDENLYPIFGYEGVYSITKSGKIWSHQRMVTANHNGGLKLKRGRWITPYIDHGYLKCHLWLNNKKKNYQIHRLIAMTFIPNEDNKPCVSHKDTNRRNNSIENLEWSTYSDNNKNGFNMGACEKTRETCSRLGLSKRKLNIQQARQIRCISKNHANVSRKNICEYYNISQSSLCSIILLKTYKEVSCG